MSCIEFSFLLAMVAELTDTQMVCSPRDVSLVLMSFANFSYLINFFETLFHEYYQSMKRFRSRQGPLFCLP